MYTYVQRPGCKKENTATYVYIRAGSRTPTRAYVRRGLVHMAGSERRNSVVVVFMGRQRNASCSWGGNGMCRDHREATERVGANRLGQNEMRGHVHREGFDGTCDGNEAWRTAERRKRTSYVRNGVLLIGRGVAYRKTEEIDLCWSATVEWGSCSSGGVWRTAKRDSTRYCSSPPSTSSSLHGLLFIQPPQRATPPATVQPPLHRLLFI